MSPVIRRSSLLVNTDLITALRRLVSDMTTDTAVRVDVSAEGAVYPLSPDVAEGLLRIGQEALTNALKHAGATQIRVALTYRPREAELRVEDNGRGFDPLMVPMSDCLGLRGMQQRMQRLGGTFLMESSHNAGTQVKATVPITTSVSEK